MPRIPSPSLVVSIIALIVALGGAGYSATGGNFILGQSNSATTGTRLSASINGASLVLFNASTGPGAAPLSLLAPLGRPPMFVNNSTKVNKLNADFLDGIDGAQLARKAIASYSLAPGAISPAIALPVTDRPVLVMGVNLTAGHRAVGQVTLVKVVGGFVWTGLEPHIGSITSGNTTSAAGTHIVSLSADKSVDIEVNSATTIRVRNGFGTAQSGIITFIW